MLATDASPDAVSYMISARVSFNLGSLAKLAEGIPGDVLKAIGNSMARSQHQRIFQQNQTVSGETLDDNEPGYADQKEAEVGHRRPLIFHGSLTEINAWVPTHDSNKGTITLTLAGQHRGKIDNILEIANEFGKNWDDAWGVGGFEISQMHGMISTWLRQGIGVKF